ncbi:hypothetical protein MHM98_09485 [Psychrobium sp. MM17-31]|uniref:hypothetical protein n=1 Tax=Psychrobium sp. MM17-31 TaxID=2917758 RepID=UPI001EF4F288|nr:hypothetical protein [Psychrobium sp. MM17-31]MCG7531570.1 hypothetical protein [Psychrobium sp. MM17-31]
MFLLFATMSQQSTIKLSEIFSQAFKQTKSNFIAFLPLIVAIIVIATYAANTYIGDIDLTDPAALEALQHKANMVTLVSVLLTPIEIGFMLMGVKASRGLTLNTSDIFKILPDAPKIIILAIISFIFVQIGMALLILPGLFLLAMISMAQPLMVDYRLPMLEAVKQSMKKCYEHAGLVLQMYTFLFILIIASFFTFGIALILTIPFYVNAKGILYCHFFDKE